MLTNELHICESKQENALEIQQVSLDEVTWSVTTSSNSLMLD